MLARSIDRDYQGRRPVLVGILNGAVVFLSDLIRQMTLPLEIDFVTVSSYDGRRRARGRTKIVDDMTVGIRARHVVIVEDIVDSGLTLSKVVKRLQARRPKSIAVCALLNKRRARRTEVPLRYVGFEIPNRFVVGYGLDYMNRYRNLKYIGVVNGR